MQDFEDFLNKVSKDVVTPFSSSRKLKMPTIPKLPEVKSFKFYAILVILLSIVLLIIRPTLIKSSGKVSISKTIIFSVILSLPWVIYKIFIF
jgi:hypothetical protein